MLGKEVKGDAQDGSEEDNHRQEERWLQEEGEQVKIVKGGWVSHPPNFLPF